MIRATLAPNEKTVADKAWDLLESCNAREQASQVGAIFRACDKRRMWLRSEVAAIRFDADERTVFTTQEVNEIGDELRDEPRSVRAWLEQYLEDEK